METTQSVIGIVHNSDTWYYMGDPATFAGTRRGSQAKYSPYLADAKRYDDEVELMDDLAKLDAIVTRKIIPVRRCPQCGKEFTDQPAISRKDNETEICTECGVKEAIAAFIENQKKGE